MHRQPFGNWDHCFTFLIGVIDPYAKDIREKLQSFSKNRTRSRAAPACSSSEFVQPSTSHLIFVLLTQDHLIPKPVLDVPGPTGTPVRLGILPNGPNHQFTYGRLRRGESRSLSSTVALIQKFFHPRQAKTKRPLG